MEKINQENKEKPPILYHGSGRNDLEEISPKKERIRDSSEGELLFATPDKVFAVMFLGPRPDDSWSIKGKMRGIYYIVISDEERFREKDKGGALYTLSSEEFECDEKQGMGRKEWHTRKNIKPVKVEYYESALNAMIENDAQVYFVDQKTFKKIKTAEDHGLSILKNLQSENQKQSRNIKSFK